MNHKLIHSLLLCFYFLTLGCSSPSKEGKVKALFNSRSEAEKAAKEFNCSGAHKMGDKWMPCKNHGKNNHNHSHH